MHLSRLDDLEPFTTLDGSTIRELVGPAWTPARNQSLAEASVPPGGRTAAHFHRRTEELYFFTAGRGRLRVGDDERDVGAGRLRGHPAGHGARAGQRRRRAARAAVLLRARVLPRRHGARRRRRLMGARLLLALAAWLAGALAVAGAGRRGDDRHRRPEARHVRRRALPRRGPPPRAHRRRLGRDDEPVAGRGARPLDGRGARGGRRAARLLHALAHGPPLAADARAPALRVPPVPRPLPVGARVRHVERGQPLRRADLPPRRGSSPPTGASSRASAASAACWPPRSSTCRTWSAGSARSAARRKAEPRWWGLHNYIDANRFHTTSTRRLLRATKGKIWLTEVGRHRRAAQRAQGRLRRVAAPRGARAALGVPRGSSRSARACSASTSTTGTSPPTARTGTRRSSARAARRARRWRSCSARRRARDAPPCARPRPARRAAPRAPRAPGADVRLAIIADTHLPRGARRLPEACVARLRAADLILHAGDLTTARGARRARGARPAGRRGARQRRRARASARGCPPSASSRRAAPGSGWSTTPARPRGRLERLRRRFPGADAVVFGHSHIPLHERDAATGFQIFNPGSPTDRRRQPRHTMGVAQRRALAASRFELVDARLAARQVRGQRAVDVLQPGASRRRRRAAGAAGARTSRAGSRASRSR